jgi:hypothetical protein
VLGSAFVSPKVEGKPMGQLVIQVALSLLSAFVASGLTAWFSLRRFYSEKWWDRKLAAYTAIMEALHHMKRINDDSIRREENGVEASDERETEDYTKYRDASLEVRKQRDLGEFLLSREAAETLNELFSKFDEANREQSYYAHLDSAGAAINLCLNKVRTLARKDLRPNLLPFP